MYHIFFIHSSVDGYLGYFHVLAIVNTAAMNFGVHVSFRITVFSGYMPRSGIASLPFFLFLFILILFFIYLFLAVLGLRCCAQAFSSCGEWELLFLAVHRLLIAVASLVAEHRL